MTRAAPLPPDRGHLATEARHPGSASLDALDTKACVELLVSDSAAAVEAARRAAPQIAAFVDAVVPRMQRGGRLVYAGAGTSGRLGVLDASECPPTFQSDPSQVVGIIAGGDSALRRSSEGREDEPDGVADDLRDLGFGPLDSLLGIAAGGTTPFVRGAVRLAAALGGLTGFLTCVEVPPAEVGCHHLIVLHTGPEVLTGSTRLKAGTATKVALNAISTAIFVRLGKVYGNLMVDLAATNDKLVDRAIRILRHFDATLGRTEAASLLADAGGRVKTAIVMHRLGVDRRAAEARLAAAGGQLRGVIG